MEIFGDPNGPMDSDLRALLAAVPEDPFVALVLADYLEERDDSVRRTQGELLRLVHTLTQSVGGAKRPRQEERLRGLLLGGVRAVGPYRRVPLGDGASMDLAWVPPGTFLMGSPDDEDGRAARDNEDGGYCLPEEGPRHEVTLSRGFWMGTTPVTQIQFTRVTGRNPSWVGSCSSDVKEEDHDRPVQNVTWAKVTRFLRRLSEQSGTRFRLPTEAEWEYACRAGTTTRFWSGDTEADLARVGWYYANTHNPRNTLPPVGGKPANAFGLHDTHGNVWEWCADLFDEDYYARSPTIDPRCRRGEPGCRVVRGGDSWDDPANCRSAARDDKLEITYNNDVGFRIVADRLA